MAVSSDWQNRRIMKGVLQAASAKLNLSTLGVSAVAAASLHSWAILALGGVAYAALAAWDLSSASFWKRVLEARQARESLPALHDVQDAEVRAAVQRMQAARKAIDRALVEAPDEVSSQVQASLGGLEELDARAARLVELAEGLARHLARVDEPALRAEAEELSTKSKTLSDAQARALYLEASQAREEQLRSLSELRQARERLLANLSRIVATLEAVPTRVVRMRVLDAANDSGSSDEIGWEIGRINGELQAMEQTLELLVGGKTT